jgi:glycosyltransferase involved in cell wall biosynthesis
MRENTPETENLLEGEASEQVSGRNDAVGLTFLRNHKRKQKRFSDGHHTDSALANTYDVCTAFYNGLFFQESNVARTRVLLLSPKIGGGGAQKVMALLARGLSQERFEVHLGLVRSGDPGAGDLPNWVTVHALDTPRARSAALPLLRLIWRVRPNVILSGAPEISFVVLLLRPFFPRGTRILVRQNSTVSSVLRRGSVPPYTRLLYRLLYRRAHCVVCQSEAMAEDLAQEIGIAQDRISVLPNPVDIEGILAARNAPSSWSGEGPHLLAVGRLAPEKGYDLLTEALVKVRERYPSADLKIAGSGQEQQRIQALIEKRDLRGAVRIEQSLETPYRLFPGATLFVLSSLHEGMPNALLEAGAAGLPIVATPASGGVVDLLRGRKGAWLAAEITSAALADALIRALGDIRPGERFHHAFFPSRPAK